MPEEIVDSCCLINLYATGQLVSLLSEPESVLYVPDIVVEESLYVIMPDENDRRNRVREEIDLSVAFKAGVLRRCDLQGDAESELLIRFATQVDDGEAVCLAIAKNRDWTVATDDRKAQRLAGEAEISVVTTPELVKRWADATKASDEEISRAVCRVRDCARFVPRQGSILYDWWTARLEIAER
jgi:predicted nucleic acid-binding protein